MKKVIFFIPIVFILLISCKEKINIIQSVKEETYVYDSLIESDTVEFKYRYYEYFTGDANIEYIPYNDNKTIINTYKNIKKLRYVLITSWNTSKFTYKGNYKQIDSIKCLEYNRMLELIRAKEIRDSLLIQLNNKNCKY